MRLLSCHSQTQKAVEAWDADGKTVGKSVVVRSAQCTTRRSRSRAVSFAHCAACCSLPQGPTGPGRNMGPRKQHQHRRRQQAGQRKRVRPACSARYLGAASRSRSQARRQHGDVQATPSVSVSEDEPVVSSARPSQQGKKAGAKQGKQAPRSARG